MEVTSVKTSIKDLMAKITIFCVKGSGWDMAEIESWFTCGKIKSTFSFKNKIFKMKIWLHIKKET